MRLRTLVCAVGLLAMASLATAQSTGTSSSKLAWDQTGVASAVDAQALTYRYYADGSATGIVLTGVTCAGTTTVTCSAPFPAFTPGNHAITLTAANVAGESIKSSSFAFVFVVVPSAPGNLRIQ
jgi:hypothetical protein